MALECGLDDTHLDQRLSEVYGAPLSAVADSAGHGVIVAAGARLRRKGPR